MSTIASPRPSTSVRSPSSTRTSFDASSARPAPAGTRRNRAALRDYYGLKTAPAKDANARISEESTRTLLGPEEGDETLTELDAKDFDADAFVGALLEREGLQGVLKVEADLVAQVRNLDSDRKSLVYDNYSKLLSATSTIRRMLGNMDPLTPTTHTLGPAISHIAETAASLSSMQASQSQPQGLGIDVRVEDEDHQEEEPNSKSRKRGERETVRWVLDTPRRIQEMVDQEQDDKAEREWEEIKPILDKWKGVAGVEELRRACERILSGDENSDGGQTQG